MSGGAYNRFYLKLDEFIDQLEIKNNPKREKFKQLLILVSKACHDIEYEDSGDYGEGDADESIDCVLKIEFNSKG